MGTPAQRLQSERAKYPAMQVDEILIWREWLKRHQSEYDRFLYDVHIGPGQDPGPGFTRDQRDYWIQRTNLRLDVVSYQGAQPFIYEVKRRAGPQNIGQLTVYYHVWVEEGHSVLTPQLVLVTDSANPNILAAIRNTEIRLDVVPTNFSSLAPQRLVKP